MEKELQKQRIKRNIVFWGTITEKYIFMMLVIILLYSIFYSYIGGEREFFDVFFTYQIIVALVSSLVAPMSYGVTYIPLVMSFGSKRKETVWGVQFMNWLIVVQMEVLLILSAGLSSAVSGRTVLVAEIALIVMTTGVALGQIAAAMGLKFGMKGSWIVVIVISVLAFAAIMFFAESAFHNGKLLFSEYLLPASAITAGFLYAGSVFVLMRVLRSYEVHR